MKHERQNSVKRLNVLIVYLLVIKLVAFVRFANADGFELEHIGTHVEPKIKYGRNITLPGTSIRLGLYDYHSNNEKVGQGRLGFLMGSKEFSYVDSDYYSLSDTNYGIYKNYFFIDGWGWGSTSGHDRLMLLCQFDQTGVRFLDAVSMPYIEHIGMDFVSLDIDYGQGKTGSPETLGSGMARIEPRQVSVRDIDHDGLPEIKLNMRGYEFFLYLEIANDKLKINLNPDLYVPLFEAESKKSGNKKNKTYAYAFYGYLSGKLDMHAVELALKHYKEQSKYVITLLQNVDKWNDAFHELNGNKFVMKNYPLGGN
jgi:hypothetical protein